MTNASGDEVTEFVQHERGGKTQNYIEKRNAHS
jgi:hypothetical protein